MIEPQGPASINGNSRKPCFAYNEGHFIIATAHRVSVGMDAVGPCDRRSQGRRPAWVRMRQEVEFRLKRDVALAPQANAGRANRYSLQPSEAPKRKFLGLEVRATHILPQVGLED